MLSHREKRTILYWQRPLDRANQEQFCPGFFQKDDLSNGWFVSTLCIYKINRKSQRKSSSYYNSVVPDPWTVKWQKKANSWPTWWPWTKGGQQSRESTPELEWTTCYRWFQAGDSAPLRRRSTHFLGRVEAGYCAQKQTTRTSSRCPTNSPSSSSAA